MCSYEAGEDIQESALLNGDVEDEAPRMLRGTHWCRFHVAESGSSPTLLRLCPDCSACRTQDFGLQKPHF